MKAKKIVLIAVLIGGLCVQSSAFAETREECVRRIGKLTKMSIGAGAGTVTGGVVGAAACTAFLGAIFVDLGLSYGLCVATVTLAGTVTGTAIAESHNNAQESECDSKGSRSASLPTSTK